MPKRTSCTSSPQVRRQTHSSGDLGLHSGASGISSSMAPEDSRLSSSFPPCRISTRTTADSLVWKSTRILRAFQSRVRMAMLSGMMCFLGRQTSVTGR